MKVAESGMNNLDEKFWVMLDPFEFRRTGTHYKIVCLIWLEQRVVRMWGLYTRNSTRVAGRRDPDASLDSH